MTKTFADSAMGDRFVARLEAAFAPPTAPAPKRLGHAQRAAMAYIAAHPGCTAAAVDRACRTARGGHKWMYATIARLVARGLVVDFSSAGNRRELYVVAS